MIEAAQPSYTSFNGHKRVASGSLAVNALAVKDVLASAGPDPTLTFCDQTCQVVDIDVRGTDAEILARLPPETNQSPDTESALIHSDEPDEPRGREWPKLGVVAREITLLPRQWDWLATQPGSASVTLRKLVEEARRASVEPSRQRRANERAYRFMSAMVGDMAGFEEASRAMFANDAANFRHQTEAWPPDVRDYVRHLACPLSPWKCHRLRRDSPETEALIMTITTNKRVLKRQYLETKTRAGVYAIRNQVTGRALVAGSADVHAILNRHRFQLRHGQHLNVWLARDWVEYGEASFLFEVLDMVKPREDPTFNAAQELETLVTLWRQEIPCLGEFGYDTPGGAP